MKGVSLYAIVLPLLLTLGVTRTHAQEITFTATIDRNSCAVGDRIKLSIQLSNGQGSFGHPDFGGLTLVGGPFESSSFNYINGKMSSTVSRTYLLTGTAPGDYTIGPAQARVGGGTLQTEPIKVHVVKGSGNAGSGGSAAQPQQGANRDLFANITLSKSKAYVGEQVTATYTLYSRYQNLELSNYDLPALTGFWAEEIDLGNTSWEDQLQVINGLQYRVAVLKKQLLLPQKSGTLRIEPATLKCLVNRSFFDRGTSVDVRSNAAELRVIDLPPGQPPGFNGTVGELTMEVTTDRTDLQANDAIDLKVRFSGRANLKLLDAPAISFPTDFETYDPKVNDRITVNGGGMSGSREFQYLVIPRHEGVYTIPPVVFSYFDTRSGGYRTVSSDTLVFNVSKGDGTNATANISRPSKTDVQLLDQDIRTIRTGDLQLGPKDSHLFGSWPWIAGMGAPALAFLFLLGWQRRRERALADVGGRRRKGADRVARQRLKAAGEALKANDRAAFYQSLGKALEGYFADKFDLGVAQVAPDAVREKLGALENGTIAQRYIALMDTCGMARFAPVEGAPRQQLYDEAAALIGTIEHQLRA